MGPAPGLAPACRADGWLGRRVAPGRLLTARSPCDMSGSVSPICGYRSRMKGSTAHPAVAAAFSTVEEDTGFTVRGFVVRGDEAAAVLLSDGMIQRTVIIENRTGQWQSPTMISETPWDPSKRPTVTEQPWLAVTALAAPDAVSVVLATDGDSHEVAVNGDGLVLALVHAPWRARPHITVRTTRDEVIRTAP